MKPISEFTASDFKAVLTSEGCPDIVKVSPCPFSFWPNPIESWTTAIYYHRTEDSNRLLSFSVKDCGDLI